MIEHKCNRCCKIFVFKNDYTRHLNRKNPCVFVHSIEEKYKCTNCGNFYQSLLCLKRHMRRSCKNIEIYTESDSDNEIDESIKNKLDEHIIDESIKNELDEHIIDESIKKELDSIKQIPNNNQQSNISSSNQVGLAKLPDTWEKFVNYINDIIEKCPYILYKQMVHEYTISKFSKELKNEQDHNKTAVNLPIIKPNTNK